MSDFVKVNLKLTEVQAKKLLTGKSVTVSNAQLQEAGKDVFVHPSTAKKINKSRKGTKGTRLSLTKAEIQHDLDTLEGGSIWSVIRSAPKWIAKNWPTIKPIISGVADLAAPAFGPEGLAARALLKTTTGIGIDESVDVVKKSSRPVKGSEEARERMAKLRAMRKCNTGGSFKIN